MHHPNEEGRWRRSERMMVAGLMFALPLMSLALMIFSMKRLYVTLARLPLWSSGRMEEEDKGIGRARRIAEIVTLTNRDFSFYQAPCLAESLTLWGLLRCKGIPADLLLGVRTITGPFESHAWVEYEGIVLNDTEKVGKIYEPFDLNVMNPGIK